MNSDMVTLCEPPPPLCVGFIYRAASLTSTMDAAVFEMATPATSVSGRKFDPSLDPVSTKVAALNVPENCTDLSA